MTALAWLSQLLPTTTDTRTRLFPLYLLREYRQRLCVCHQPQTNNFVVQTLNVFVFSQNGATKDFLTIVPQIKHKGATSIPEPTPPRGESRPPFFVVSPRKITITPDVDYCSRDAAGGSAQ